MKLSIIIPYWKTYELTYVLLANLNRQLNEEVEVILVEDGLDDHRLDGKYDIRIVHLPENRGLSYARNIGLELAHGEFVTFIDSDDNVATNYIKKIIETIDTKEFDCCLFSWKSTDGNIYYSNNLPSWNNSVWNCIYRKDKIGTFKTGYQVIEDKDFNDKYRKGNIITIPDVLYYYYQNPNGISARHDRGEIGVEEKWHCSH